jgi:tryptophanyl-tRNA synthetase
MTNKKKLVSGIQASGKMHIGNYFGAMRQFVNLQDEYDSNIFIADYHALTTIHDSHSIRENSLEVATDYLAVGLDPEKVTLYKQSDVPEHMELAWIFNCLVTVPYLERAHAYKDKIAKGLEANAGLFTYPVLMAADILMYDADLVPVGQDQKQHIEYARDIAEKFNNAYGEIFKFPEAIILEGVETVPGTDGQKMSKSYGNTIPLFAEDDEIREAVMKIPTDSLPVESPKDPSKDFVFAFHRLFANADELADIEKGYKEGGLSYKESKDRLVEEMTRFITPLRERRKEVASDADRVKKILGAGSEKARATAQLKMKEVREKIGISKN